MPVSLQVFGLLSVDAHFLSFFQTQSMAVTPEIEP